MMSQTHKLTTLILPFYIDINIGKYNKPYVLVQDKPKPYKQYALTGGFGVKCIANGNTWQESEV
mgnify:CR=1 FL=1